MRKIVGCLIFILMMICFCGNMAGEPVLEGYLWEDKGNEHED